MFAVGLEVLLHVLKEAQYASETLSGVFQAAEYIILGSDLLMLFYRIVNGSWLYARGLLGRFWNSVSISELEWCCSLCLLCPPSR